MRRNPMPYLLAVAMASNVGSTATITGNPQNIMIGSFSRHSLRAVRGRALAPVALVGLALTVVLIALLLSRGVRRRRRLEPSERAYPRQSRAGRSRAAGDGC